MSLVWTRLNRSPGGFCTYSYWPNKNIFKERLLILILIICTLAKETYLYETRQPIENLSVLEKVITNTSNFGWLYDPDSGRAQTITTITIKSIHQTLPIFVKVQASCSCKDKRGRTKILKSCLIPSNCLLSHYTCTVHCSGQNMREYVDSVVLYVVEWGISNQCSSFPFQGRPLVMLFGLYDEPPTFQRFRTNVLFCLPARSPTLLVI